MLNALIMHKRARALTERTIRLHRILWDACGVPNQNRQRARTQEGALNPTGDLYFIRGPPVPKSLSDKLVVSSPHAAGASQRESECTWREITSSNLDLYLIQSLAEVAGYWQRIVKKGLGRLCTMQTQQSVKGVAAGVSPWPGGSKPFKMTQSRRSVRAERIVPRASSDQPSPMWRSTAANAAALMASLVRP